MFHKILIANRGEVACRIIQTCRRLGIKTVAIYSNADQHSLHVSQADEAYYVGESASIHSYLNIGAILKICHEAKVDAVHPGFGFLAENADFAEAVNNAGFTFIGPKPEIIRLMGDKLLAKEVAMSCGLPLVPGLATALKDHNEVISFAKQSGYPVLLKAAAGGGGKGMRIVYNEEDIANAFTRCQSEALSSFGDPRIFVEKYIVNPRHVEVQILGDKFGNILHFGERDCSIQRRHQKIIEETPCASISRQLRQQLCEAAVKLATEVKYDSAGTVEFVVTQDESFYFLEMNTRLQVEHPVTEACYGIDLVEQMIMAAAEQKINLQQKDIVSTGHAIEVRIYAEDANNNFLPSAGKLTQFLPPLSSDYRLDRGIEEGDEISIYYDPMIAKLICHGKTRQDALTKLKTCLNQFIIEGPANNIDFLNRVIHHPKFESAKADTHFIETYNTELSEHTKCLSKISQNQRPFIKAVACAIGCELQPGLLSEEIIVFTNQERFSAKCVSATHFIINNISYHVNLTWLHQHQAFEAKINDISIQGLYRRLATGFELHINGYVFSLDVIGAEVWPLLKNLPKQKSNVEFNSLRAPMPGVLIDLPIKVGDKVKKGQTLAIIEAMKMENALKAPSDGVVSGLFASNGDTLQRNQIIAKFS